MFGGNLERDNIVTYEDGKPMEGWFDVHITKFPQIVSRDDIYNAINRFYEPIGFYRRKNSEYPIYSRNVKNCERSESGQGEENVEVHIGVSLLDYRIRDGSIRISTVSPYSFQL